VSVTRAIGAWHFKALYSEAFRTPSIENLNINPTIRPERTRVVELEVGYQLNRYLALVGNGFWVKLDDPIVYTVDPRSGQEGYFNFKSTGTAGAEAEVQFKHARGQVRASYSFYSTAGQNQVDLFTVPNHPNLLLGSAAHKVALNGTFHASRSLSLNLSGILLSDRYGYFPTTGQTEGTIGKEGVVVLANVSAMYRNVGIEGLNLSAGVFNLADARYLTFQPYQGSSAPLPAQSREFFVRLAYRYQ
jgi:outer membrane cobalamin receptor